MKGVKSIFTCTECGYSTPKWFGKCPSCGSWNTAVEDVVDSSPSSESGASKTVKRLKSLSAEDVKAVPFGELVLPSYSRISTGIDELDRALGGGLVSDSVVLLCGEPGIGKSTLLLQICSELGISNRVMYVSGEESKGQIKMRAKRLGITGDNLFLLTDTDVDNITDQISSVEPDVVIIDSIQTMYTPEINSTPGSVSQVKESALRFISIAKPRGISFIFVGHVNKEGSIAGPKVLEHMVDTVMYFEGERKQSYRIIRAVKNRFGSTDEIGVFEMTEHGLNEVRSPSEMLLAGRPLDVPGNCSVCIMEGTRPIIAEIQALATPTSFSVPRRTASGIDYNRMYLILAVLEKRLGIKFSVNDVYLNVIGGLQIDEPASDLATALALLSSFRDVPVPDDVIAIGEIGLSGECRSVSHIDQRISEAIRMGFKRILVPYRNAERSQIKKDGSEIIPVRSVFDAAGIFDKGKSK